MTALGRKTTSSWIPWAIAGVFAIVIAVNVTMAWLAIRSAPGLAAEHAFDEGRSYNEVLARGAAQDTLGWQAEPDFVLSAGQPPVGRAGEIRLALRDRSGHAIAGASVTATLTRPVGPPDTVSLPLAETADGVYAAATLLAGAGQWEIHVTATRGADSFALGRRILVR
jgi:nitrogen fixation protein FixH